MNGIRDARTRPVDVHERPLLQPLREQIVLFTRNIVTGSAGQFIRVTQAATPVESDINRRVIAQILAIIDSGLLDLANGCVDFVDRFPFLGTEYSLVGALQMRSGESQIAKGAQIRGMPRLRDAAHAAQDEEDCQRCYR